MNERPYICGIKDIGPFCGYCSHGNSRVDEAGQVRKGLHGKVRLHKGMFGGEPRNACGRCASERGLGQAIGVAQ